MLPAPAYDQAGAGWITDPTDPRLGVLWAGAADYAADDLAFPLYVAAIQCERFAPALADNAPVPEHYIAGQVLQTRALVRAGIAGSGDQTGGYGEQTVTVFPLDWTVKQLLRPRRGRPYFGGRRPVPPAPGLVLAPVPGMPGLYTWSPASGLTPTGVPGLYQIGV